MCRCCVCHLGTRACVFCMCVLFCKRHIRDGSLDACCCGGTPENYTIWGVVLLRGARPRSRYRHGRIHVSKALPGTTWCGALFGRALVVDLSFCLWAVFFCFVFCEPRIVFVITVANEPMAYISYVQLLARRLEVQVTGSPCCCLLVVVVVVLSRLLGCRAGVKCRRAGRVKHGIW